jgi:hypothetical protein
MPGPGLPTAEVKPYPMARYEQADGGGQPQFRLASVAVRWFLFGQTRYVPPGSGPATPICQCRPRQ